MNLETQFAKFWEFYPRKVGKIAAKRKYLQAFKVLSRHLGRNGAVAKLQEAVEAYGESWAGNRGTFTPHCSRWLHEGRYDDDRREWRDPEERKREHDEHVKSATTDAYWKNFHKRHGGAE